MTSESSEATRFERVIAVLAAAREYRLAKENYNVVFDRYDSHSKSKSILTWKKPDWDEHLLRQTELRKAERVLMDAERAMHDAAMES